LSLFVCLLATLHKNLQTDLHEIFRDPDTDMDMDPYHDSGKMCLGGGMHCPS